VKQSAPKQELSIEIGDIDGVHVDDIDVPYAAQSQILQQLTAQTTYSISMSALQVHRRYHLLPSDITIDKLQTP